MESLHETGEDSLPGESMPASNKRDIISARSEGAACGGKFPSRFAGPLHLTCMHMNVA